MCALVPGPLNRASPRRHAWLRLASWLLLYGTFMTAVADPQAPAPVPALDASILQTQAPGDSRLLVKRRTPLPGSLLKAPAPRLPASIPAAYETALGNNLYIIKLFENLPRSYLLAIARALSTQPDFLSASVLNEHATALSGTELAVPFPAIHTDQAFDLYIPRKGGQNAPVVLILGCVGGDMPQLPGVPHQLLLPFLASAAAEQYGAVVACMSPAESETDLTHPSSAQATSLAARQAANDAAIQGVLARIGQLTGANTARFELVGGQTAVPQDGATIALRYALAHVDRVDRLALDANLLPALVSLSPVAGSRIPARPSPPLRLTALLASTATQADASAWLQAVQQLAASRQIALQATVQAYQDCNADLACPIGPSGEMPMLFSALLGPPPAGTALLALSVGPDRRVPPGSTVDLPELVSGVVLGQAGSNASPGMGWTAADGGALPAGATVVKSHLSEKLQFISQQPGHYAFRLRLQDVKGNTAQAYANVEVRGAPPPLARLAFTIRGPAQARPGSRVLLQAQVSGSNRPRDVMYEWRQTGGPAVTLTSRNGPSLLFTAPMQPAAVVFRLTVTDPSGQVATGLHLQRVFVPLPPKARPPLRQPARPPVAAPVKPPRHLPAKPPASQPRRPPIRTPVKQPQPRPPTARPVAAPLPGKMPVLPGATLAPRKSAMPMGQAPAAPLPAALPALNAPW
jgi:hypothetical protein